jgi:hypothetical protein
VLQGEEAEGMKTIFVFFLSSILFACNNNPSKNNVAVVINKSKDSTQLPKEESAKKSGLEWDNYYEEEKSFIKWTPHHSEGTGYDCELNIREEYVNRDYNGQCAFYYFTYRTSDTTLDILWSSKMDCVGGVDFLEKSNGVNKHPRLGDTFCTFTLKNDSVIKVKYYFPEWVKKVNSIAKDSIFPVYFYLERN